MSGNGLRCDYHGLRCNGFGRKPLWCLLALVILSSVVDGVTLDVSPTDDWTSILRNAEVGSTASFAPGTYVGACNVPLERNITLLGSDGSWNTIIDCRGSARHFHVQAFATIENITLRNGNDTMAMTGLGGGCVLVDRSAHLTVRNTVFEKCLSAGNGGAILISSGGKLVVEGSVFRGASARISGGGVAVLNGTATMLESQFLGCRAEERGGGVYGLTSAISMDSIQLISNTARDWGGAAYIEDGSAITVTSSQFEANRAGEWSGQRQEVGFAGAIGMQHSSTAVIHDDVSFIGNEADWAGGAICAQYGGLIQIVDGVLFKTNFGGWRGGALFIQFEIHVEISRNVNFLENVVGPLYEFGVDWLGGALAGGVASGTISHDVNITNNYAAIGGGVFSSFWDLDIHDDVRINDNMVFMLGGGLMAYEGRALGARIRVHDRVQINRNNALYGQGGGFFGRNFDVEMYNEVQVRDNYAFWEGGGIYFFGSTLTTRGTVDFANCFSEWHGGAIATNEASVLELGEGTSVVNCLAWRWGGGIWVGLSGGTVGGSMNAIGLVCLNNSAAWSGGCLFIEQSLLHLVDAQVSGNEAGTGGGLGFQSSSRAVIQSCVLSRNSAGQGGGIEVLSSQVELLEVVLSDNVAASDGGALLVGEDGSVSLNHTTMERCSAGVQGGGVATLDESVLVLRDTVVVRDCVAGSRGGGYFLDGSYAEFVGQSLSVAGCHAGAHGGGICYSSVVEFKGAGAVIAGNTAQIGGGVCGIGWGARAVLSGDTVVVEDNEAAEHGGGWALVSLAQLAMTPLECPSSCKAQANNSECNFECLLPGCNWDGGDCNYRFEKAGEDARKPCDRSLCSWGLQRERGFCRVFGCMVASCDWSRDNEPCVPIRQQLATCPLWDAVALESILQQKDLVYVKEGGTAVGYGRCLGECVSGGQPTKDAECLQDPACSAGLPDEPWCQTVDDGGRVLKANCIGGSACTDTEDGGVSWGVCSPQKPRLPGVDFDYDVETLLQVLKTPIADLVREFPGCGKVGLVAARNRAGRNGGGLYKSSCNIMLHRLDSCYVDGIEGSMLVNFEDNVAGSAGGAVYVECDSIGDCSNRIPFGSGSVASVNFVNNVAATWGDDVASGARDLLLSSGAPRLYVPGQTLINVSFSMTDALGNTMQADQDRDLPLLVAVLVCDGDAETCSTRSSLQPSSYYSIGNGRSVGSSTDVDVALRYCKQGMESVRIFVSMGDKPSYTKALEVSCIPCQVGQAMVVQGALWTCSSCGPNQYVVNIGGMNPNASCQSCPVGARCQGGELFGTVQGSVWVPDVEGDQHIMRLISCPPGYQKINYLSADDPVFQHGSQQCQKCAVDQYILNPNTDSCQTCPTGAACDGHALVGKVAGSVWESDLRAGIYRLTHCPDGYQMVTTLNGVFSAVAQECHQCTPGLQYILDPATHQCMDCPQGALCPDGSQLLPGLPGDPLAEATWEPDHELGIYRLTSCPPGFQLVNSTDGTSVGTFSALRQRCKACTAVQYIVDPNIHQCQDCPLGGECDGRTVRGVVNGSLFEADGERMRLTFCPAGYQLVRDPQSPGLDDCVQCPPDTYSLVPARVDGPGNQLVTSSTAEAATGLLCTPCMLGAKCPGGDQVLATEGWWLKPAADRRSEAGGRAEVYRCPPGACTGGTGDAQCGTGREGPVCGICAKGYALGNGDCVKCDAGIEGFGYFVYVAMGLGALAAWFIVAVRPIFTPPKDEDEDDEAQEQQQSSIPCMNWVRDNAAKVRKQLEKQKHLMVSFKVVISFYQLLSSFIYTFNVEWGSSNESVMQFSSLASFNLIALPGPSCMAADISHATKLILFTITPIAVVCLLLLPASIASAVGFLSPLRRHEVFGSMVYPSLVIQFVVYPMVTYQTLTHFRCQDLGDGLNLLASDYTLSCPLDNKAGFLFLWSLVFGVLYSAGSPLAFYLVMKRYRVPEMAAKKEEEEATQQMVNAYKRKHQHDVDGLMLLLGLNNSEDEAFARRCGRVYAQLLESGDGAVTGDAALEFISANTSLAILPPAVARVCKQDAVSEAQFFAAMVGCMHEASLFQSGDHHSFDAISDEEMRHLLAHKWENMQDGAAKKKKASRSSFSLQHGQSFGPRMSSVSKRTLLESSTQSVTELERLPREELAGRLQDLLLHLRQLGIIGGSHLADWEYGEDEDEALHHIGFLFRGYRVGAWYWELVEMVRKFVFASMMTFIFPGSRSQLLVAFVITAVFLMVTVRVRPFKDIRVQRLHMLSSVALCFSLFYAIALDVLKDDKEDFEIVLENLIAYIAFVLNVFVVVFPFVLEWMAGPWSPVLVWTRFWRRRQKEAQPRTASEAVVQPEEESRRAFQKVNSTVSFPRNPTMPLRTRSTSPLLDETDAAVPARTESHLRSSSCNGGGGDGGAASNSAHLKSSLGFDEEAALHANHPSAGSLAQHSEEAALALLPPLPPQGLQAPHTQSAMLPAGHQENPQLPEALSHAIAHAGSDVESSPTSGLHVAIPLPLRLASTDSTMPEEAAVVVTAQPGSVVMPAADVQQPAATVPLISPEITWV